MTRRICYTCRETYRGHAEDPCENCGSFVTGPVLGSVEELRQQDFKDEKVKKLKYVQTKPYDEETMGIDGFYEGDFDGRDI